MKKTDFESMLGDFILHAQKAHVAMGFVVADIVTDNIGTQMARDKFVTNLSSMNEIKDIASITYGDNKHAQEILCKMNRLCEMMWVGAKAKRLLPINKDIAELRSIYDNLDVDIHPKRFHAIKHETPMKLSISSTEDEYESPVLQIELEGFPITCRFIHREGKLMHAMVSDGDVMITEDVFHIMPMMLIDIISGGSGKFNTSLYNSESYKILRLEAGEEVYYSIYVKNTNQLELLKHNKKMEAVLQQSNKEWMFDHISATNEFVFRTWETSSYPEYTLA